MHDLTIYDSQGVPLAAAGPGEVNERIKDFFFGGVRVALETVGNRYRFTAFFRARDSAASRSEQYYGVLETTDGGDLSNFREIIERHMGEEFGKDLVTSKDDTTVFEELGTGSRRQAPGNQETKGDVADLLNDGQRALIGVRSYEDATNLLTTYLSEIDRPRLAIAENAQNTTLSDYDLVIEKGPYTGLELLGDTAERIESLKERKRREREQMLGDSEGVGPYGQQRQTGPLGLESTRVFAVGAGAAVVLLLVVGAYGACFAGVSLPMIGSPPLMDCTDDGGTATGTNETPVVTETTELPKTTENTTQSTTATNSTETHTPGQTSTPIATPAPTPTPATTETTN